MNLFLECKKVKRTGFLPVFLGGGILSAAVPVLNMAVRQAMYMNSNLSPTATLLGANWQMMSMLNILLVVTGACILYNTEYTDNAVQRMSTLPVKESALYFGKAIVMTAACIMILIMEAVSIFYCSAHWFGMTADVHMEILRNFGFFLLLMLPVIFLSLSIASACRNLWISLGIGVICVFLATVLPMKNFILSLFPFSLPFQTLSDKAVWQIRDYSWAGIAEAVGIVVLEIIFLRIRRKLQ